MAAVITKVSCLFACGRRRLATFFLTLWLSAGLAGSAIGQDKPDLRMYFFTMSACPPCAQAAPIVDQFLSAGYPIQKVDARLQPQWAQQFKVASTPTFVMTIDGQEVGRYSGVLSKDQLQNWFQRGLQAVGKPASPASSVSTAAPAAVPTTQPDRGDVVLAQPSTAAGVGDTMHVGTREPGNEIEKRAMAATVRIQVEDGEGISTATGTVIHSHGGESLVMTCGHVFREAQGKGVITADVNWLTDQPTRVSGELINYDAGALDVALVLIRPGFEIPAVPLATRDLVIEREQQIFSIGCDRNAPPTIRRSRIKDIAVYDGARKYDIYGRPVLGRSGGGLFSADGLLIGVCNAAAVEVDEGIYSAIDNLYSQLDRASLAHLFSTASPVALAGTAPRGAMTPVSEGLRTGPAALAPLTVPEAQPIPAVAGGLRTVSNEIPVGNLATGLEAIVILRDRSSGTATQTVVIPQPSNEFLSYVRGSWSPRPEGKPAVNESEAALQMARLREEMPQPAMPVQPQREARAQSPQ